MLCISLYDMCSACLCRAGAQLSPSGTLDAGGLVAPRFDLMCLDSRHIGCGMVWHGVSYCPSPPPLWCTGCGALRGLLSAVLNKCSHYLRQHLGKVRGDGRGLPCDIMLL